MQLHTGCERLLTHSPQTWHIQNLSLPELCGTSPDPRVPQLRENHLVVHDRFLDFTLDPSFTLTFPHLVWQHIPQILSPCDLSDPSTLPLPWLI